MSSPMSSTSATAAANGMMELDVEQLLLHVLSPMWMEFCMCALALACYMAFAPLARRPPAKGGKGCSPQSSPRTPLTRPKAATTSPEDLGKLLEQGRLAEALDHFATMAASSSCCARLLCALARQSGPGEDVAEKLAELKGRFDARVLEVAAAEVLHQGDWQSCRRLYKLAGLVCIPTSPRALALLVRGHAPNLRAMRELVDEVTAEGASLPLSKDDVDAMWAMCEASERSGSVTCHANADINMYIKAISAFGKEGRLERALGVFNALRLCGHRLNQVVHNCLLDACVQCKDMQAALRCFAEMRRAGLADAVSYNTVVKGHAARGEVELGQTLLEEMAAAGLAANHFSFHPLLHAMALRGDQGSMWRLVEQMEERGHAANAVTCSIMLRVVSSPRQCGDLERILAMIEQANEPSDEILFAALAEACIRTERLELLSERLQIFSAQGGLAKLPSPIYGAMIKAYGLFGDVQRVRHLWAELTAWQVQASAITVGCTVEALVVNGHAQEAWELLRQVWDEDAQSSLVNTITCTTILKGFAMAREHEKVTALYEEMVRRNVPRNTITFNTILNSIALCGLMNRVPELLKDMREAEPPAQPDKVTYSTIIKGYCRSGELDSALKVLRKMRSEATNTAPDEVTYNSLLDGCSREGRLEEALRLLGEMREAGVAPSNYTLSIMCKTLGRARRLDEAFTMVEAISREYGFRPNMHVYTALMQACAQKRQLGRAFALHDKIIAEGLRPDEKTYTTLASGCLQAGETERAATVVRCAYHLPSCTGLRLAAGPPQGVEERWLQEVLSRLEWISPTAAKDLCAELLARRPRPGGNGVRPPQQVACAAWRFGGRNAAAAAGSSSSTSSD